MEAELPPGLRVLLVEDVPLVAMNIEAMLDALGCVVVAIAERVDEALRAVEREALDAAVLDVSLDGVPSFPVADALAARGVPFVFATGHGEAGLREDLRGRPALQKPFRMRQLAQALAGALPPR